MLVNSRCFLDEVIFNRHTCAIWEKFFLRERKVYLGNSKHLRENAKPLTDVVFLHFIFFPSPCPFRARVGNVGPGGPLSSRV